ncbi:hypothetical protein ACIBCN_19795 [Nocardia sp. NPDC051052]|uniref:hypothetical protein n=1 Tax=Nocardia sp. NPDC051052 TaxID=3364322 RepID=UPI0037B0380F
MDVLYLLEYYNEDADEATRIIGLYSTDSAARQAIERLGDRPEFRDRPEDFHISRVVMDEDDWTSGFFTYNYTVE